MSTTNTDRTCEWCDAPIAPDVRRDAIYCRKQCRQAAWRFSAGAAPRPASLGPGRRFAYADPPYPGKSRLYYADHPDFAGEVDHGELIDRLLLHFPDGWALSTDATSLSAVLKLCPDEVRVAAWVRGERPTSSYLPLSSWEPVIVYGGRRYLSPVDERRLDSLVHVSRPRTSDPRRVVGAKPARFAYWLFDLLGALPGDELVDVFPGSGGIARAWAVVEDLSDTSAVAGETRLGDQVDTSAAAQRDPSTVASDDTSRRNVVDGDVSDRVVDLMDALTSSVEQARAARARRDA